jgi:hypothetical protein
MRTTRRMLATTVLVVILASIAAGVTLANGLSPSASVTTAIQGWERWLNLEWTAEARTNGQEIDGYVYNKYGSPIDHVQLLAQGLDGAGNVVHQTLSWVPGSVPGLQRAYFRIPAMPRAERYRVTVWAFDIVQSKSMP